MRTMRKPRHRGTKSEPKPEPEKDKDKLLTILLKTKVSDVVNLMDNFKIREFAKQYPEKTFSDLGEEILTAWVEVVKKHPEEWGVTKEQIEKLKKDEIKTTNI
ncbi:Uncharacterised protein [uncultured archaeon]|nr:Uncharacterised protein [uncultured archaeon]